jgi:hypothetical protein
MVEGIGFLEVWIEMSEANDTPLLAEGAVLSC